MKIRRFFATDMRKALRQVSEELGPDAAIMSTRKTQGGVEVVAATDYDAVIQQHKDKLLRKNLNGTISTDKKNTDTVQGYSSSSIGKTEVNNRLDETNNVDIEWSQEPNLIAIRNEVALMRELLQDQLGQLTWRDKGRRNPIQAAMLRKMVGMGFSPTLSDSFAKRVTVESDFDAAWQQLTHNLCDAMPTVDNNILQKGGILALVGPTGVGKTTTVAKLAARYVIEHGSESVALVTTDSYRVAAHEQLRTYANIMGVTMRVAADAKGLSLILDELSDKQLILIDTAGISQRDKRLAEQMSCLMNAGKSIDSYLVLSATSQTMVLKEAIKTFSTVPIAGVILTKLDESVSLGESLGTVIAEKLKLAFITDGQCVPEDLHKAVPEVLLKKASSLGDTNIEDWMTAMALNQG